MKLLKYMLCASMCMSFGVAHAEWEHLGVVDKPVGWNDMEVYGYMYNSEQDTDNAMVLVRTKYKNEWLNIKYYITPGDCVTGQGVLRVVYENGAYYPAKFNLINLKTNLKTNFLHLAVMGMCNKLSSEDKFTKSDDLKVRKHLEELRKKLEEKL